MGTTTKQVPPENAFIISFLFRQEVFQFPQLVFAVKNRDALIKKEWKDELEKYITGIVQNHRHKMLAIGSMPDHMHILSQEEHHKKKPFKEEYWEMLEKNNVEFNQEYLFEFFDDIYEWD